MLTIAKAILKAAGIDISQLKTTGDAALLEENIAKFCVRDTDAPCDSSEFASGILVDEIRSFKYSNDNSSSQFSFRLIPHCLFLPIYQLSPEFFL